MDFYTAWDHYGVQASPRSCGLMKHRTFIVCGFLESRVAIGDIVWQSALLLWRTCLCWVLI